MYKHQSLQLSQCLFTKNKNAINILCRLWFSLREHPVFSALVSTVEKNRLRNRTKRKISVTSAVSDQSQFTLHIRRSNARVFAWILRKCVGKHGGRCVEERIGSFLVWKTQQASKWSLAMFFVNLPTGFGKSVVFQTLSIVYSCVEPSNWSRKKRML